MTSDFALEVAKKLQNAHKNLHWK